MKILKFLKEKKTLVAFDNQQLINNAEIKIKNNHLNFTKENDYFVFIDNFDRFDNLVFNVKEGISIRIYLITYQSKNINIEYDFVLNESSSLELFTNFNTRKNNDLDLNMNFKLSENARLKLMNALIYSGNIKLSTSVNLNGKKSACEIEVLNIGHKNYIFTIDQFVRHLNKSTVSNINNSLISNQMSKLNYSVSGFIAKGNEMSKAHQNNKGIMLSDKSEIEVEPKLFIDEYNVEASHGAAIGQMDEMQLYYLLSRGLTEQEARSLIIFGYTNPFISMIEDKDIKRMLTSQITRVMKEKADNE
ncbi:MAG: SufD family Fe-S cluster assembly protein [Candidatus Izemoplasmatales bacterium]|jgi:Fe-S cluster assembly protein SufD|nr:SufD family Fe-S cluster assembly protein [Candidatus Izemoplasmatales bacterium]